MFKLRKEILQYVLEFRNTKGYAPSIAEVQQGIGKTTRSTIYHHLKKLQELGLIENLSRSMTVTKKGKAYLKECDK
jgi:SOS-response transcriptional repressor LexA